VTRYFQVYDADDDGQIDAGDFERVVENVRILRGESDHDGVISRTELMSIAGEFDRGTDPDAPGNLLFGLFGI
jgi:Ca2+-binding EF-hand superfamily protein